MEAICGQNIAPVVGLVDCPVVPQAFRAEYKNPVIAQLVVFDNSQGLPKPTLSAMMQPPKQFSLSMAPTTPSLWNLKSFFHTIVLRILVAALTTRSSSSSSPRSLKRSGSAQ